MIGLLLHFLPWFFMVGNDSQQNGALLVTRAWTMATCFHLICAWMFNEPRNSGPIQSAGFFTFKSEFLVWDYFPWILLSSATKSVGPVSLPLPHFLTCPTYLSPASICFHAVFYLLPRFHMLASLPLNNESILLWIHEAKFLVLRDIYRYRGQVQGRSYEHILMC